MLYTGYIWSGYQVSLRGFLVHLLHPLLLCRAFAKVANIQIGRRIAIPGVQAATLG